MKKTLALLLAGSMCLSMLAACGSSSSTTTDAATTTTTDSAATSTDSAATTTESAAEATSLSTVAMDADVTVVDYADISTMHPLDTGTTCDSMPMTWVYDSLLALDPDMEYVWLLATSCDVNDAGDEYTFYLREGITFSDGEPWNAEAAKVNIDMMADQSLGYKNQYKYDTIESTEVVDEYTITVCLTETYAPFLTLMAASTASMMSPALIEQGYEAISNSPVGTGQYTLTDRVVGEYTTYTLNRDWWGYDADICGGTPIVESNVGFNTITLRPVSEEATRVAMVLTGEADIINSVSYMNKSILSDSGATIVDKSGGLQGYFYLNSTKEVFSDIRVRQAIAMAIDVVALNEVVYGSANEPADSIMPSSFTFYESQGVREVDIDAAKALLTEAGYPDGFSIIGWEENDSTDIQRGEFIIQQLANIGITLTIYPQEGGFLTDNVNGYSGEPEDTEFDCYVRGFSYGTGDADEIMGRFHSDAFPPMGSNYSWYVSDEYDALIELGASSIDPEVRAAAYAEAQALIWEDCSVISLLNSVYTAAHSSRVGNLEYSSGGTFYMMSATYAG